jgi:putative transcriptional regulator
MRRHVRGLIVRASAIVSAMKDPLKALGDKVRAIRIQLDLSQESLAERCDFDRTYISLIERGQRNPSFTNMIRLAEGLEVSVSDLTKGI